ncbi:STAS domain-containing protein [Quadrisphaera granulorum]|uniref:STAS domain-containing protein n=1 Tax=Quadrisphaera granulorum TaxID=317664 RepID=A0A316A6A8_9ACTN|nr:STAS domain-containing protein [Quadrisphaera granulorum]PWJ53113.1 STAS domain-containing protein [Quadrisphaera granulorum]SZE97045.1 STAS domain-containing protein [Quadrisphaera granulorum]
MPLSVIRSTAPNTPPTSPTDAARPSSSTESTTPSVSALPTPTSPSRPSRSLLLVAVEVHSRGARAPALCVMTLTGRLDHGAGPNLRSALERALLQTWAPRRPRDDTAAGASASAAAPDVVVDAAGVDRADDDGIAVLLSTLRRTTALGGRAAVVGASDHVRTLLTAGDDDGEVRLHARLADAVSAWTPARSRAWTPSQTRTEIVPRAASA